MTILWIGFAGAAGSVARYLLGGWLHRALGEQFPYGTLLVNVLGSFLLMLVMHLGLTANAISDDLRAALAIGLLGGFTTYSAFNYELLRYFQDGAWTSSLLYGSAMMIACLVAGGAGLVVARWIAGG